MPTRDLKWRIPDLVDLEYFLVQDAGCDDESVLIHRDRKLYRSRLAAQSSSRAGLLRRWLDLRREEAAAEHRAPLPGEVADFAIRLLPKLLFVLAALTGITVAWGVLSYSGAFPINLIAAFSFLVILPLLFTFLSVALPGWRLLRRGSYSGMFGGRITGALLLRLCERLYALGGGELNRSRQALSASWGILRGRGGLHSGVVGWFAFRLMQLSGLAFALGVFLTVLLRGLFTDLAFSWQTTAEFSSAFVHSVVSLIALPWSGLADPPVSHPTLEQVAGSRVYLKEGLQHLASADLQSWWYFLLWSILAYAVIPGLFLFAVSLWNERRAWKRISFHDARADALIRRMQHAQVKIGKEGNGREDVPMAEGSLPGKARNGLSRLRTLVPGELVGDRDLETWQRELQAQFNAEVLSIDAVKLDEDQDAELLRSLAAGTRDEAVLLLLEGWQPCINATLEYLKALRHHLGKERLLIVTLAGRECNGTRSATPDLEFSAWKKRLASLADPALQVHNWQGVSHE
jgi:hypothetical protein